MLPAQLLDEVDELVEQGHFPTREDAIAALVRIGLTALKQRAKTRPQPPLPPGIPPPPGYREPREDQPIIVHPWDTRWV